VVVVDDDGMGVGALVECDGGEDDDAREPADVCEPDRKRSAGPHGARASSRA
jgi:hypothetical protein